MKLGHAQPARRRRAGRRARTRLTGSPPVVDEAGARRPTWVGRPVNLGDRPLVRVTPCTPSVAACRPPTTATTTSSSSAPAAPGRHRHAAGPRRARRRARRPRPLPSDTISTHSLVRGGVVQLARWGLLDEVLATGRPRDPLGRLPPARTRRHRRPCGCRSRTRPASTSCSRRAATSSTRSCRRGRPGRRHAAGPDHRDRRRARRRRPGHRGHRHRGATGPATRAHAPVSWSAPTASARGWRGSVGRARSSRVHAPSGACLYTYVGGRRPGTASSSTSATDAFAGVFPTHDGEACVWLIRPSAGCAARCSPPGPTGRGLAGRPGRRRCPSLAERVASGTVTAPCAGRSACPTTSAGRPGPGWALVGDAGYHRDPITGHGITDAFRDAELLAEAADARAARRRAEEDVAMRRRTSASATTRSREIFAPHPAARRLPGPRTVRRAAVRAQPALDAEAQALAARHVRPARRARSPDRRRHPHPSPTAPPHHRHHHRKEQSHDRTPGATRQRRRHRRPCSPPSTPCVQQPELARVPVPADQRVGLAAPTAAAASPASSAPARSTSTPPRSGRRRRRRRPPGRARRRRPGPDAGRAAAQRAGRLPDGRPRQHRGRPRGRAARRQLPASRATSTCAASSASTRRCATASSDIRVVFEVDGDAEAERLAALVDQSQARSAVFDVSPTAPTSRWR